MSRRNVSPIRVLLVDDDDERETQLLSELRACGLDAKASILRARSKAEATAQLSQSRFDVLILDLVLPRALGGLPDPTAGLEVVEELVHSPKRRVGLPSHVVVISGERRMCDVFDSRYGHFGWVAIRAKAGGAWQRKIAFLISQIASARNLAERRAVDVLLFAALPDPELTAVRDYCGISWAPFDEYGDGEFLFRASIEDVDGVPLRAILATASRMGPYEAGVRASMLVAQFTPSLVAMPGICASLLPTRHEPMTVVVASSFWDYDSGKYQVAGRNQQFVPKPLPLEGDDVILQRAKSIETDAAFHGRVLMTARLASATKRPLAVEIGTYATGASVVADNVVADAVRARVANPCVLEMEAYSVALAVRRASVQRPRLLVAKAVSDFADKRKNDRYRFAAAVRSAAFCVEFARQFASSFR